jgi:hypothetical protein
MRRIAILAAVLTFQAIPRASAQNPEDIEFHIRFMRESAAFHAGEPMDVEVSYASTSEKKYRGTWTSLSLMSGGVSPTVLPMDGVMDLRDLLRAFSGSGISSEGDLTAKPYVQHLELNEWLRFRKPGHYSLTITSQTISRIKGAVEGGGLERLTLESNSEGFEILPVDPAWNASELAEIERLVQQSQDPQERYPALRRLGMLDTPESVQRLMEIYLLGGPQADYSGYANRGLNESAHADLIIGLLEASLSDPTRNPQGKGADLLAEFQVRKELGMLPHRPEDEEGQKEWQKKLEERNDSYNRYFAKANSLLLASMKKRSGPERVGALYEAWSNAERQNAGKAEAPESLTALREEVLNLAKELSPQQQLQFAISEWANLPHEQLKPMVESVANNRGEDAVYLRNQGYELWCRDWLKECSAAIVADFMQPGSRIDQHGILMVQESEHPELDSLLTDALKKKDSNTPLDSQAEVRLAAMVLRAGSRNLRPAVDSYLQRFANYQGYGCEAEGYLIGYLFRFDTKEAAKRTLQELYKEKGQCGVDVLMTLNRVGYTDELGAVATTALDSPNPVSVGTAVLFLGAHGAASAEKELQKRLAALRESWRGRAADLSVAETSSTQNETAAQAARLEQYLVSALVRGASWKITDEARQELRTGCMTEKCRSIADGKMSFGF